MRISRGPLLLVAAILAGCGGDEPPPLTPYPLTRLVTERDYIRDAYGRYVFFHGINLAGSSKVPAGTSSSGIPTYVGRPFPLSKARTELAKIRSLGFDTLRLLVLWEGVEPEQKGKYDTEYLSYLREVVKIAGEQGLHVLLDMHQDMFSRHLSVRYNETPPYGAQGSIENMLLALVPPYTDRVQGDGAPRWVVEACLPEKNLSSPNWGVPRVLSGLEGEHILAIIDLYQKLSGTADGPPPSAEWITHFLLNRPAPFPVNETSDLLPFTHWGLAAALSLDLARCVAAFFAGDKVFPDLKRDGQSIKDYLQDAYAGAWVAVAKQMKDLPNVVGYDLMNEPISNFLPLSAVAGVLQSGSIDGAHGVLVNLLGKESGDDLYQALLGLRLLPPDSRLETLQQWGLAKLDLITILSLNNGFDEGYLRPLYERVGRAIQDVDPRAVFFIEGTVNAGSLLGNSAGGVGGQWEITMTRPQGLTHVVYSPHWYPDIYPLPGFNQPSRSFTPAQVRFRDYRSSLETARGPARYSLGNLPVVFGEFGTYFNFGGIQKSISEGFEVSAQILDNYYENFEQMFQSRIQWCFSSDNDDRYGDHWNKENFSVVDPAGRPRAAKAWSRPHARALAGKPIATHFYSDLHYFDPDKGEQMPWREFEVSYASKETPAPTEIVVPSLQYPDGFYVWVSDGRCHYDARTQTLYHYPSDDAPGAVHWVRLLPPLPHRQAQGWQYFFKDEKVISEN